MTAYASNNTNQPLLDLDTEDNNLTFTKTLTGGWQLWINNHCVIIILMY